jgi:hypothetical protein
LHFLTAVFSYNRGQLLENCVRSIERFSPSTDIVVFDDQSEDPRTRDALRYLVDRGHEVLESGSEGTDAVHGNLFTNMNRALDVAHRRGSRLLHLMQDDTQFLWREAALAENVTRILDAFPDACQVTTHFWRRLGITSPTILPDLRVYRMASTGDLGFVDVDRLLDRGFRFENSERGSALRARRIGLEAYSLADPVVARVPWPMHARHRRMLGKEKPAGGEFLLTPLDEPTVSSLLARDVQVLPYGEDYYAPWGWRCWKPYPISPSYASWLKALTTIAVQRRSLRGLVPRRAGVRAPHERVG